MALNRRELLASTIAGAGVLAGGANSPEANAAPPSDNPFQVAPLGKTGVKVSLTAMGTGMRAWMRQSNTTKLGQDKFDALLRHAFDRGIRYFDCADMYGSHQYLARTFAKVPRDKLAISTKIWYHAGGIPEAERPDPDVFVDRFRKELNTDYIDLVMLHCMTTPDWREQFKRQMDVLAKLKQKGVIRAHGVSVHSTAAMQQCIDCAWVDSVHARINAYGDAMDNPDPNKVAAVVRDLRKAGKGVVGMKLVGEGRYRGDPQKRDASIRFALQEGQVNTMIVGFETPAEIDDFAERVRAALKERNNRATGA